ncbi:hypothetical protein HDU91_001453 [Kappamyces sp. JEL0680]|nr:hypothetical protein HDU91_001453 [Kappamyces sp. JEL0680]
MPNDEFLKSIQDIKSAVAVLKEKMKQLEAGVSGGNKQKGISLLDVRGHAFISYLQHLLYFIICKLNGLHCDDEIIWTLVRNRVLLEKTKPLELKLKYQIDKLVKAAVQPGGGLSQPAADLDTVDPLSFKPNASAMAGLTEHSTAGADGDSQLYKPPRVAPMPFDGDGKQSKNKLSERVKERASKSRLLRDLQSQFDERPEDVDTSGMGFNSRDKTSRLDQEWQERQAFEEENFIRLAASKKQKHSRRQLMQQGGLLRFNDEFADLEKDFKELRGVHRAVEMDHREAPKASRKAKLVSSGDAAASKKRSFQDVDGLISSMASKRKLDKGMDKFLSSKK